MELCGAGEESWQRGEPSRATAWDVESDIREEVELGYKRGGEV